MAQIIKTSSEFADIISIFLLDKLQNMDKVVIDNIDFNMIMEIMKDRGMKTYLLKYYMALKPLQRMDYKRIRSSFTNTGKSNTIVINGTKISSKEKEGIMKKILKKALTMLVASKQISDDELEVLMEDDYYEEILNEINEEEKE